MFCALFNFQTRSRMPGGVKRDYAVEKKKHKNFQKKEPPIEGFYGKDITAPKAREMPDSLQSFASQSLVENKEESESHERISQPHESGWQKPDKIFNSVKVADIQVIKEKHKIIGKRRTEEIGGAAGSQGVQKIFEKKLEEKAGSKVHKTADIKKVYQNTERGGFGSSKKTRKEGPVREKKENYRINAIQKAKKLYMIQQIMKTEKQEDGNQKSGFGSMAKKIAQTKTSSLITGLLGKILLAIGAATGVMVGILLLIVIMVLIIIVILSPIIIVVAVLASPIAFFFLNDSEVVNRDDYITSVLSGYYTEFNSRVEGYSADTSSDGYRIVTYTKGTGFTNLQDVINIYLASIISENLESAEEDVRDEVAKGAEYPIIDKNEEKVLLRRIFEQMNYTKEVAVSKSVKVNEIVTVEDTVTIIPGSKIGKFRVSEHTCGFSHGTSGRYGTCVVKTETHIPVGSILRINGYKLQVTGTDDNMSSDISVCRNKIVLKIFTGTKYEVSLYEGAYTYHTSHNEIQEVQKIISGTELQVYHLSANEWCALYGLEQKQQEIYNICLELSGSTGEAGGTVDEGVSQSGDAINDGQVKPFYYYNQGDGRWAQAAYGTGTIKSGGCGPSSCAMVISSLTSHTVDPVAACAWAQTNGYCVGNSSAHTLIRAMCETYGLTVTRTDGSNQQLIKDSLRQGKLCICIMGPGTFTSGGHFLVLRGITEDGKILVGDSGSRKRTQNAYDLSLIVSQVKASGEGPIWIISR